MTPEQELNGLIFISVVIIAILLIRMHKDV